MTNDLQHLTQRQENKRSGNQSAHQNNMDRAKKSIAEELMDAINYHQMRAHPAYISESDAVLIRDFTRSELAEKYALDTVNLYWPGKLNTNHVFEIFSEFLPHGDAGKTRCDMINFVSDHKARYSMDAHTVLKMHETNLTNWACKQTYYENCADELSIYALSDLTKKHTVIITSNRPWTTVHQDVGVRDIYHLLEICDVRLLYLGNLKFGRLRDRPLNCNNPVIINPPVFPGYEPPGLHELETAESLVMMQNQGANEVGITPSMLVAGPSERNWNQTHTDAMEVIEDRVQSPVELCMQKGLDAMDKLSSLFNNDAMYMITGYIEPIINYGQPKQDCMEEIIETRLDAMDQITGYTEPNKNYGQPTHDGISVFVETDDLYALVDPVVGMQMKDCSVRIMRIDDVLAFVPERDFCSAVMNRGRPHTRSQCMPKPPRTQRHPRKAHNRVTYIDNASMSEDDTPSKKQRTQSVGSGPSDSRISSQHTKTDHPKQRELTVCPELPSTSETGNNNSSDADTESYSPPSDIEADNKSESNHIVPKGKFTIKTKSLKKAKTFNCSFCDDEFDSAKLLDEHQNNSHKIMYCGECSRAFSKKTTYARHIRSHTKKGMVCNDCGKKFGYQSQLNTHKTVHSNVKYECDLANCDKKFKNKGDLVRHLKQHSAPKHKCLDCEYENADIRNFESHQLYHSRIAKYHCDHCEKDFVYNSQLQRHLKDNECQRTKSSASPDY